MPRHFIAFFALFSLSFAAGPGTAPSDLALHDMNGKKVRLRDFRGKPVVLNFWATWCGPCRHEMPLIAGVAKTWAPKGVVSLEISLDEKQTRGDISNFMHTAQADLPVWIDASAEDLEKLGLGNGVPDTAFIDERGVIVARVLGEIRPAELDQRLAWLTGDRTGAPPEPLVNHMPAASR